MNNMLPTIVPKSDQANYDDFIGGITKTVKITKVNIKEGEQPISMHYEGDNGKPYKPCKSMARVLVHCWGADANLYVGRSMTLYGDPEVVFGGQKVGGIRISHLSHIDKPLRLALTATRATRKPYTVLPLEGAETPSLDAYLTDIGEAVSMEALQFKYKAAYKAHADEDSRKKLTDAKEKRKLELAKEPGNGNDE